MALSEEALLTKMLIKMWTCLDVSPPASPIPPYRGSGPDLWEWLESVESRWAGLIASSSFWTGLIQAPTGVR